MGGQMLVIVTMATITIKSVYELTKMYYEHKFDEVVSKNIIIRVTFEVALFVLAISTLFIGIYIEKENKEKDTLDLLRTANPVREIVGYATYELSSRSQFMMAYERKLDEFISKQSCEPAPQLAIANDYVSNTVLSCSDKIELTLKNGSS